MENIILSEGNERRGLKLQDSAIEMSIRSENESRETNIERDKILKQLGEGTANSKYWNNNIISCDEVDERAERILNAIEFASEDIIRWVLNNEHWSVKTSLARKENCPEDIFMILVNDTNSYVRQDVAEYANLSPKLIGKLYNDKDEDVRLSLSVNESFIEFLDNTSREINDTIGIGERALVYDAIKKTLSLVYDDSKHTIRKVELDPEKNILLIYGTKDTSKVVGTYNLETRVMKDLRKPKKTLNKGKDPTSPSTSGSMKMH